MTDRASDIWLMGEGKGAITPTVSPPSGSNQIIFISQKKIWFWRGSLAIGFWPWGQLEDDTCPTLLIHVLYIELFHNLNPNWMTATFPRAEHRPACAHWLDPRTRQSSWKRRHTFQRRGVVQQTARSAPTWRCSRYSCHRGAERGWGRTVRLGAFACLRNARRARSAGELKTLRVNAKCKLDSCHERWHSLKYTAKRFNKVNVNWESFNLEAH